VFSHRNGLLDKHVYPLPHTVLVVIHAPTEGPAVYHSAHHFVHGTRQKDEQRTRANHRLKSLHLENGAVFCLVVWGSGFRVHILHGVRQKDEQQTRANHMDSKAFTRDIEELDNGEL
jgi:hypothetical protein